MKSKIWNIIGLFYTRIINRMRCGDNRCIRNWETIMPDVPYDEYNKITNPLLPTIKAHTFWHGEIEEKQIFCLKSFLATQNMSQFELILWLDGDESYEKAINNSQLKSLIRQTTNKLSIKKWDVSTEIAGTIFEKSKWYFKWDRVLPFVADDFRIICLYKYGGLYFDLDVMFVKDFTPLLMRGEFVYAWENQPFANNAVMYFRRNSYLINVLAKEMIKKKSSQPWVLLRYSNKALSSLMVYPCAMFDPLWLGYEDGMPISCFSDFFRKFDSLFPKDIRISSYKDFFPDVYAYHWHNHWNVKTSNDSYFGMFNKEFSVMLDNDSLCNHPNI